MDTFTERFRYLLRSGGLTHDTAAVVTGLSEQGVAFLSAGRRVAPRPETITKIARALAIDPAWLLWGTGNAPSPEAVRAVLDQHPDERVRKGAARARVRDDGTAPDPNAIADRADDGSGLAPLSAPVCPSPTLPEGA